LRKKNEVNFIGIHVYLEKDVIRNALVYTNQ